MLLMGQHELLLNPSSIFLKNLLATSSNANMISCSCRACGVLKFNSQIYFYNSGDMKTCHTFFVCIFFAWCLALDL